MEREREREREMNSSYTIIDVTLNNVTPLNFFN